MHDVVRRHVLVPREIADVAGDEDVSPTGDGTGVYVSITPVVAAVGRVDGELLDTSRLEGLREAVTQRSDPRPWPVRMCLAEVVDQFREDIFGPVNDERRVRGCRVEHPQPVPQGAGEPHVGINEDDVWPDPLHASTLQTVEDNEVHRPTAAPLSDLVALSLEQRTERCPLTRAPRLLGLEHILGEKTGVRPDLVGWKSTIPDHLHQRRT